MTGRELDELRKELGHSVVGFSQFIGVSPLDYHAIVQKASIQDPRVLAKILQLQLQLERENLDKFGEVLSAQPTGPFSAGKVFAHIGEIATLKGDPVRAAPITVEWHLSNACNHDCPFCTFRDSIRDTALRGVMFPDELVPSVIEDLRDLRVKAVVYSGGGEPLLHPKAANIMESVKAAGIRQGLITNGARVREEATARTITSTCDWVRISVDAGSESVYKTTHGKKQDFQGLIESVEHLVKQRQGDRPRIGVSFLLTMLNYTDILASARRFKDVGVDYFQVKPIVISADDRLRSGNIFWKTAIFDQLNALPAQAQSGYAVYTLGFKFVDMMKAVDRKPFRRCHGHPFYPTIAATGEVYVCCLMLGSPQLCYGKITKANRLKDLWCSPERVRIGESVEVRDCPVNCKLSETNKALEQILGKEYEDACFLN